MLLSIVCDYIVKVCLALAVVSDEGRQQAARQVLSPTQLKRVGVGTPAVPVIPIVDLRGGVCVDHKLAIAKRESEPLVRVRAMVTQPNAAYLGVQGFPPERGLYDCTLGATGLHVSDGTQAHFREPDQNDAGRLQALWKAGQL